MIMVNRDIQNQQIQKRNKRKNRLYDETLPYFKHERRCHEADAINLFDAYPMSSRNELVLRAQLSALCAVLANMSTGKNLILPNFSRLNAESWGYSRQVFLNVLQHLEKTALISRLVGDGELTTRSIITYSTRIRAFKPVKIFYQPGGAILINEKKGRSVMAKIDSIERRNLKNDIKNYWAFIQKHTIKPGLDKGIFDLLNEHEQEILRKPALIMPDEEKIFPYAVFNSRDLTLGGRLYGAFWIGCKKEFRRLITIDGELTADLDGKAMHTQLLYKNKGYALPPGDPYIHSDWRRTIYKKLMLLMLNTKNPESPIIGRKKVIQTYIHHYGQQKHLDRYIDEIEKHHHLIMDELYRPNWGHLQKTEAAVMLKIMSRGISDDVVILPVHDGCLCQRRHTNKVLSYFKAEGIIATENRKHLQPLPLEEIQEVLRAHRRLNRAID
jgi:hypothetical protein